MKLESLKKTNQTLPESSLLFPSTPKVFKLWSVIDLSREGWSLLNALLARLQARSSISKMAPSRGWQAGAGCQLGAQPTAWVRDFDSSPCGLHFLTVWCSMRETPSERVKYLCLVSERRLLSHTRVYHGSRWGDEGGARFWEHVRWKIWLQPFLENRTFHFLHGNCLNVGL